jgi:hypothetical protein
MPNLITAQQLRDVLGVSDSLYSDAYLEEIIDSAEQIILPMLTAYQSAIKDYVISKQCNLFYYATTKLFRRRPTSSSNGVRSPRRYLYGYS